MLSKDDLKLSKELSYALRHRPSEYNVTLDDNGWCKLDSLLEFFNSLRNYGKVDVGRIQGIMDNCDKKRFEIDVDNNRIRATYGHSIKDHPIVISRPEQPPYILYHGTSRKAWEEKIQFHGLKPMDRQYVHLSTDIETAKIVGKRHDENPVIIMVYSCNAWIKDGVKFYHSTNDNTWMSEPISAEYLLELKPLTEEYVKHAENRLVELEKKMYDGHEINSNVFAERGKILFMLSTSSKERIKKILDMFESFPNGLWRRKQYPNIDKYIRTMENIRNGKNFDKLTGELNLQWYDENERVFGYTFTHGTDDGFPETTSIKIPSEFLYLDEKILHKRITEDVLWNMRLTRSQLNNELANASDVINKMEKEMIYEK